MTNTIEIQAINGFTYRFMEFNDFLGTTVLTYCAHKNEEFRQICRTFHSLDEAREWINELNESIRNYKPMNTNISIPHEYDDCSRYYGD